MTAQKISEMPEASGILSTDLMMIVSNEENEQIPIQTFFSAIPVPVGFKEPISLGNPTAPEIVVSGQISLTTNISHLSLNGNNTISLGAGIEGQMKLLVATQIAGTSTTILNLNLINTSITFTKKGDSAFLVYTNGAWGFFGGTATVV